MLRYQCAKCSKCGDLLVMAFGENLPIGCEKCGGVIVANVISDDERPRFQDADPPGMGARIKKFVALVIIISVGYPVGFWLARRAFEYHAGNAGMQRVEHVIERGEDMAQEQTTKEQQAAKEKFDKALIKVLGIETKAVRRIELISPLDGPLYARVEMYVRDEGGLVVVGEEERHVLKVIKNFELSDMIVEGEVIPIVQTFEISERETKAEGGGGE